jgi:prevent-host-death family protein
MNRMCTAARELLSDTEYGANISTMDLTEDIEPVTALKRGAAELISRAAERHSPIIITQNGRPTAVLQDVASYERQRRALHLLKLVAQGEHDYDAGRVHDAVTVDAAVRERLAARRHRA